MTTSEEIYQIEENIRLQKEKLAELRKKLTPIQLTKSYAFDSIESKKVDLITLFGNKNEMIMISNMGKSCPYCTLWADGFTGLNNHLQDRAAFIVLSPDNPETVKEFSKGRNWNFPIYSDINCQLRNELGFKDDDGNVNPGVISLSKNENNEIFVHHKTFFGPGDNFCIMWDFIDMLPLQKNWAPKYTYN